MPDRLDLWTQRERLADTEDGRVRHRIRRSQYPLHYEDPETGELRDESPEWVDQGTYWEFRGRAYGLTVPKDRIAIRYRDRRGTVDQVIRPAPDQVAPELRPRDMLYWPDVWPGHDIYVWARRRGCEVCHVLHSASARDQWAWDVTDPDMVALQHRDRVFGREGRDERVPSTMPDQSRQVRVRTSRERLPDGVTVRVHYSVDGVLAKGVRDVIRTYPVWIME